MSKDLKEELLNEREQAPLIEPVVYDQYTQDLINAGKMAMIEKNFIVILANLVKQSPNKRLEVPLDGGDLKINLQFQIAPDKLVIFEGEMPAEPIIQLASQMPKSATPQLKIQR